mmetsp:Transcript_26408/g.83657  ORF Transcript_26408/g.83657 Transcript_26408/m.83657 type:complete len:223 (-) Transcript_26408:678-1346(-)
MESSRSRPPGTRRHVARSNACPERPKTSRLPPSLSSTAASAATGTAKWASQKGSTSVQRAGGISTCRAGDAPLSPVSRPPGKPCPAGEVEGGLSTSRGCRGCSGNGEDFSAGPWKGSSSDGCGEPSMLEALPCRVAMMLFGAVLVLSRGTLSMSTRAGGKPACVLSRGCPCHARGCLAAKLLGGRLCIRSTGSRLCFCMMLGRSLLVLLSWRAEAASSSIFW